MRRTRSTGHCRSTLLCRSSDAEVDGIDLPLPVSLGEHLKTSQSRAGYDPTDPELIGPEMEPMDFAPITMRLLGFPEQYVRPEHQAQLQRVLRQHEELRTYQRMGSEDWDRSAAAALAAFLTHGRMPTESRYLLYVLTIGEQFALAAHRFGKGREDLIAAYEAVATTTGEERVAALRRLGELQARQREAK